MMSKLIAMLALTGLSFAVGVGVMMHGWGLTVDSWGWVVFGALGQGFILAMMNAIGGNE